MLIGRERTAGGEEKKKKNYIIRTRKKEKYEGGLNEKKNIEE